MYAEKPVPSNVQSLLKSLATFLRRSAKKNEIFADCGIAHDVTPLQNLSLSDTSYLNLQHCISRVLEMWVIIFEALATFRVTERKTSKN